MSIEDFSFAEEQTLLSKDLLEESTSSLSLICRVASVEGSNKFLKKIPELREVGVLGWNYDCNKTIRNLKKLLTRLPAYEKIEKIMYHTLNKL